jgi:hypothetical protein
MAKEIKDKRNETGIPAQDLQRVIKEAVRQRQQAAEYSGLHGRVVSGAVERYGIEKNAFTAVRRASEMEETKRQSFVRSFIDYSYKMGFFDQLDLLDDTVATLRKIIEDVDNRKHNERTGDTDVTDALAGI